MTPEGKVPVSSRDANATSNSTATSIALVWLIFYIAIFLNSFDLERKRHESGARAAALHSFKARAGDIAPTRANRELMAQAPGSSY